MADDLEHIADKEMQKRYSKTKKDFDKRFDEKNLVKRQNNLSDAHFQAYTAFEKKFNKSDIPKAGKSLSENNLNDLMEEYLVNFLKHADVQKDKDGKVIKDPHKGKIDAYNRIKKDLNENERSDHLRKLAVYSGLASEGEAGIYDNLRATVKKNKRGHAGVVNEAVGEVLKSAGSHRTTKDWNSTFGHSDYKHDNDTLKQLLHDLHNGNVDIEKESKFYHLDTHQLADDIIGVKVSGQTIEKEKQKEYGIKIDYSPKQ